MFKNLSLAVISSISFLIFVELIARIWLSTPLPYPIQPGILVLDQRGFWLLEPNYRGQMDNRIDFRNKALTIGPAGDRTIPCKQPSAFSRQNIVLVGDSQTFGFGLSDEETWANQLQCQLNKVGRKNTHVINLGVFGINIDQYYMRIRNMVAGFLRPNDVVVVGVTWNDLHTRQSHGILRTAAKDKTAENLNMAALDPQAYAARLLEPLTRHQPPTWRYDLHNATGIFIPSFESFWSFAQSMNHVSVVSRQLLPVMRLLYYRLRPSDTLSRKITPDVIDGNMELLRGISDIVEARGAHLIVYMLPNRPFYDDFYFASDSQGSTSLPAQDYMSYLILDKCDEAQIVCITSFDELRTSEKDSHSFVFDGHYNETAAKRIADGLFNHLTTSSNPLVTTGR